MDTTKSQTAGHVKQLKTGFNTIRAKHLRQKGLVVFD